jgi:hypothetical protein
MHIHGHLNLNSADLYSAAGAEKAAAMHRAADVRKKLLTSSLDVEGAGSPEEAFMIGQWSDSRHSQVMPEDEYRSAASGRDEDFG